MMFHIFPKEFMKFPVCSYYSNNTRRIEGRIEFRTLPKFTPLQFALKECQLPSKMLYLREYYRVVFVGIGMSEFHDAPYTFLKPFIQANADDNFDGHFFKLFRKTI